jgi:hypothetical protein
VPRALGRLAALALLLTGAGGASAAALGSLAASAGLLPALGALLMARGWSARAGAVPLPAAALALSAAALLLWRVGRGPAGTTSAFRLPRWPRGAGMRWLFRARGGAASGFGIVPCHGLALPEDVDARRLDRELRDCFVRVQAAWDGWDVPALRVLTTEAMRAELCAARCECRSRHDDAAAGRTDVLALHAALLSYERRGAGELVCVEFSGTLRESPGHAPAPFRELWMLVREEDAARPGAGWVLARQQALL